jgi:chorismate lyase/3-hydroxybenzoate synthase
LLLDEADYADLDAATFDAYRRIRRLVQQMDYPYLLRTWNYFPDINGLQHGEERYRAFSQGRYRALANASTTFETTLPAACAIGTHVPGLLVYFLAARMPGKQIENPRQVSAFRYPPQYGPRSPSFSRAILKRWGVESHLYISGTASIVGHASQHPSHPLQQLDETLVNLETLLGHANRYLKEKLRLALIKVYIRPGLPIAAIQQHLQDCLGSGLPKRLLLTGDICRDDLLLEIEGLGISP